MFRILTEEKNIDQIKAALSSFGLDFTLFSGLGSWKGQEEKSLAVGLDNISRRDAEQVAQIIKSMNCQEAVLLQEFPIISQLV